ncbi:heterotrimeric G protein alpha subunit 4 [Rhizoctonia solani AG-1 IA]|uniref:Heterotrimeric G protein alpha subunit 4 n=1 Tax=Thanatephorus cucumeris (strain AG1-IA) TaxID=983506 RepID=L8X2X5_THACA|nr:heterotrimeric G protein alpha subunit 4 [Rhizoctonia solani AG-1 IA]
MGNCFSNNNDPEATRAHHEVERELKAHAKKQQVQIKVLLLGSGDSGKSTVLKQMRIIHNDKFTQQEVELYRQLVFNNIIRGAVMLGDALTLMQLQLSRENERFVEKLRSTSDLRDGEAYPMELLQPLQDLWGDAAAQQGWSRANEVALPENFFGDLPRVFQRDYIPTTQDIIRCRAQTTGITETVFKLRGQELHLIDVGGQRSERRKWIHCFQDVTTILFLVSLNGYDQCLFEDSNAVGIFLPEKLDAMAIWDSICDSEYFRSTNIDYEGPEGDAGEGRIYFRRRFLKLSSKSAAREPTSGRHSPPRKREIYTHFTNATDTALLRVVMAAVEVSPFVSQGAPSSKLSLREFGHDDDDGIAGRSSVDPPNLLTDTRRTQRIRRPLGWENSVIFPENASVRYTIGLEEHHQMRHPSRVTDIHGD